MSKDDKTKKSKSVAADAFEREVTTDLDEKTPDKPKGPALHTRILIGLIVGVVAGVTVNYVLGGSHPRVVWIVDHITGPIGQLFLRLLLMIVVPLVFSSLVVGVAGIGDIRKLGRVGLKSFVYCFVLSAISVIIGLTLANTIRPGDRIAPDTKAALEGRYGKDATTQVEAAKKGGTVPTPLMQVVETIVPSNPLASIAGVPSVRGAATCGGSANMAHLMFSSLVIRIPITLISVTTTSPVRPRRRTRDDMTAKIIEMIMKFAPYAVACLLFNNTARFGLDLLQALAWFVLTVLLGLALHMFGVYSLSIYFLSRLSPLEFFRRIKTVILTAFS